jgi:hypothetical protein
VSLWRRRAPVPPRNVRVLYPDGREVPVECVYAGRERGQHVWTAAAPACVRFEAGMAVLMDPLPRRTTVSIGVAATVEEMGWVEEVGW